MIEKKERKVEVEQEKSDVKHTLGGVLSCRCDNEEWIHSGIFHPRLKCGDEALAAQRGCVNAKLKKMAESCVVEYSHVSLEDEDAEKCLLLFLKSLLLLVLMLLEMI